MRLELLRTTALVSTISPGATVDGPGRRPPVDLRQALSGVGLRPARSGPGAFGAPLVCGDGEIYFLGELPLDDPGAA